MSSWFNSLASALALSGCVHSAELPPRASEADDPLEAALRQAPHGNTLVRCSPSDAQIVVDGVERGLASDFDGRSRLLSLEPGSHTVIFRRSGYQSLELQASAERTGRQTLEVVLTPFAGMGR